MEHIFHNALVVWQFVDLVHIKSGDLVLVEVELGGTMYLQTYKIFSRGHLANGKFM